MTAYSNGQYAQRDPSAAALNIPLVTIRTGHPLNNPHRAPFVSGATAARALFEHARTQLSDPAKGQDYFNALRKEFLASTLDSKALDKRLTQRSARAARALSNSDLEPSYDQLQISATIATVQGRIAEKLIPNVQALGLEADRSIDLVDTITRRALTNTVEMSEQRYRGEEERPINNWQDELAKQLADARQRTGSDTPATRDEDAVLIRQLDQMVNALEKTIPDAVERPEPLYEIDEIPLDPKLVEQVSRRLTENLDSAMLTGDGTGAPDPEIVEERARRAIWQTMSPSEREFLATHSTLNAQQRTDYGLAMVALTPPLVRLPENDLHTGRFDVRMNTQEEAVVMDAMLRWAGETKVYPGPEASIAMLNSMQPATMLAPAAPENAIGTLGIIVDSNDASLERARETVRYAPPDIRLLIHSDNENVRNELMQTRIESLREAGVDRPILDAQGANRDLGGWMMPGDNDRVLGANAGEHDMLVANSTKIAAFTSRNAIKTTSYRSLIAEISKATQGLTDAEQSMNIDRDNLLLSTGAPVAKFGVLAPMITDANYTPERFAVTVSLLASGKISNLDLAAAAKEAGLEGKPSDIKAVMSKAAQGLVGPDGKITEQNATDANRVSDVAGLTRLLTVQGQSAETFKATVEQLAAGTLKGEALATVRDQTGIKNDSTTASEKLAVAARLIARENGTVPAQTQKLAHRIPSRFKTVSNARYRLKAANDQLDRYEKRDRSVAFDRAGEAGVERAEMISAAYRLGKLQQVYVPARGDERGQIETAKGNLVKMDPLDAAISANTILAGADYDRKMLRDSLTTGIDSRKDGRPNITATLIASSNFFSPSKGAEAGLAEMTDRLAALPERGVILLDDNQKNPMVKAAIEWSKDNRQIIQATAWRVTDTSENNIERSTKVDFGYAPNSDTRRIMNEASLSRSTVIISGGGMMTQKTWDAIEAYLKNDTAKGNEGILTREQIATNQQKESFRTHNGLTPDEAVKLVAHINRTTGQQLELPKIAEDDRGANKSRAIMQEALVDLADQAIIGTDLGRDYHSANLIRLSAESGKLSAVIGSDGKAVPIAAAVEHSTAFAKSMAERTLDDLNRSNGPINVLTERTDTTVGRIVLENLSVSDPARVKALGDQFTYLSDIQAAAARGDASIPKALQAELASPSTWKEAADRKNELGEHLQLNGMYAISKADRAYPPMVHDRVVYTMGSGDFQKPLTSEKIALITGENSKANQTDLTAIRAIAEGAKEKGWAVSIHLNGELAASAIKTIAHMPEDKRPDMVVVTDGHPRMEQARLQAVMTSADKAGAILVTPTAPLPKGEVRDQDLNWKSPDHDVHTDRASARTLHAEMASAVVVVKAHSKDPALLSLKTALENDVPVAAVASVRSEATQAPARAAETEVRAQTSEQAAPRDPSRPVLTIARPLHPETERELAEFLKPIEAAPAREPEPKKQSSPVQAASIDWGASEYAANRKLLVQRHAEFTVPTGHHHTTYETTRLSGAATGEVVTNGRFGDVPYQDNRQNDQIDKVTDNYRTQPPSEQIFSRDSYRGKLPHEQAYSRDQTRDVANPDNNAIMASRPNAGVMTTIATSAPALALTATNGAAAFIEAVQEGKVSTIRATERDLAERARERDDRFLHTSNREQISSEVRAVFSEMHETAEQSYRQEAAATLTTVDLTQAQMAAMKQRADAMGR